MNQALTTFVASALIAQNTDPAEAVQSAYNEAQEKYGAWYKENGFERSDVQPSLTQETLVITTKYDQYIVHTITAFVR